MKLDPAVAHALSLGPEAAETATVSRHGGSGFSTTAKIGATADDGVTRRYFFMKTAAGPAAELMFRGEHASLNAIHAVVPSLSPQSLGHGLLDEGPPSEPESNIAFLVTEFLDLNNATRTATSSSGISGLSLAAKLGKLHTTPAPMPEGSKAPVFGFPVPTCCGDTVQPNDYKESWADFYAENRLLAILGKCETANGKDEELRAMVESTIEKIVPRLLRDGHYGRSDSHGGTRKVTPVVVHGDLWSGNKGRGVIGGRGGIEDVIFDPSACYASSEYEWGIMKMFGGFDQEFEKEYHEICPKMEPVEEYEDRIRLYELYHHMNHAAIFGTGYRAGALNIMRQLQKKYGGTK